MTTRRKFLKKSIAASAAFFIVPRHVLGRGFTAPSDKLGIAAIGIGGRGTSNLKKQIIEGLSESEIRDSWKEGLEKFKKIRKKYLLY